MKIYTRTGDGGESSLYNGTRHPKDADTFGALGDVDELNSLLGVAREYCDASVEQTQLATQFEEIQSRLFDVGSAVATPTDTTTSAAKKSRAAFNGGVYTEQMERWIDDMDETLPQLTQFILPSGGKLSAFLHLARTVCRRAERAVIPLSRGGQCELSVPIYLNRLSDYLFTASRYAAKSAGAPETTYKKAQVPEPEE